MDTIDVSSKVLFEMAQQAKVIPTNFSCNHCGRIVSGLLPNNKVNNFVYGVVTPHYRIICGIHEQIILIPYEKIICFCSDCEKLISKEIPEILLAKDPKDPTKGGHFITTSKLNEKGETKMFSRWQSDLENFRKNFEILLTL